MNKEMKMMFNAILEELSKVEERLGKLEEKTDKLDNRTQRIEQDIERLYHEVNASKLEKDTILLLIRRMDQLESRFDNEIIAQRKI